MTERFSSTIAILHYCLTRLFGALIGFQLILAQPSYTGLYGWYHPESMALAGAGSAFSGVESDRRNPATLFDLSRKLHLSLVQYPVNIRAKYVSLIIPKDNKVYAIGLRHLGYGNFDGMDFDGEPTGEYSSGDTWLTLAIGQKLPDHRTAWGLTAGLFVSQLESYQSILLTLVPGVLIIADEFDARVGLSLQNAGIVLKQYTNAKESPPATLVGSFGKKLAHLPLELSVDAGYRVADEITWVRLGGIFYLTRDLQFKWGMSTDKFSQQTQTSLTTDFLGSTGFGIAYNFRKFRLDLGGYFYGTGGWITGMGFGVDL